MSPPRMMIEKLLRMLGDDDQESEEPVVSFPRSHFVDVPHVRQQFNWDCGLACVLMVMKTLGINNCNLQDLEKLCPTTSIWTVDLAYSLHEYSVRFSFCTVTLGVNPNYSAEAFYKDHLEDDLGRVDSLFGKALEIGVSIQCRSISGKEISSLILSGQYIAIALVNKIKLSQSWLKEVVISRCHDGSSDYTGTDEFEIRDPASTRKYERVPLECLDEAHKSFGTDEDIIFVVNCSRAICLVLM